MKYPETSFLYAVFIFNQNSIIIHFLSLVFRTWSVNATPEILTGAAIEMFYSLREETKAQNN